MIILTIRTDKPEAAIGIYKDDRQLAYESWQAHRELAETIHMKIRELLASQSKGLHDISAIIAFQGPGSFTGLRIGLSVCNALASGLRIPIVGSMGEEWIATGVRKLLQGENEDAVLPEYGAPVHITQRKQ